MIRTEGMLSELSKETVALLEDIGGRANLKVELSYYDAGKLQQQFPTVEDLIVRLFDSWWNTTRRQLLIKDKFHKLRQAVYQEGTHRLSSMSRSDFESWLIHVFGADTGKLSRKWNWNQFVDKGGAWDCLQFIRQFPASRGFYDWITAKVGLDSWGSMGGDWERYASRSWHVAEKIAYHDMPAPQSGRKGIYGMGTVLVCDFLKEVGVNFYGKPDSQIKQVFQKIDLIGKRRQEWATFELFWHIAMLTGHPPAVVDKIFWMAASGRWDKTLDKALNESSRKEQQQRRKQRFGSLLGQFASDA